MVAAECGEAILKGGARRLCVPCLRDERCDRFERVPSPATIDYRLQSAKLKEAEPVRFLPDASQAAAVHHFGEVEEGPRHGCHRDRVDRRPVVWAEPAFVEGDPSPAGAPPW